jgi:hypothetical protein
MVFVPFTSARPSRKSGAVQFWCGTPWPHDRRKEAVPTRQSSTNFDLVAPFKARACDALSAVVRTMPRKLGNDAAQIMRKGAERC